MYWDNNRIGLVQNGLEDRGFRVNRVEIDGLIVIKGTAKRNQTVEIRFRLVMANKYERVA